MGLDMYLRAEKYIGGWDHGTDEEKAKYAAITAAAGIEGTSESPSCTVSVTIGYWRKANAIHNWFVQNVQGGIDECQEAHVDKIQLGELRAACQKVLAASKVVDGKVCVGHTAVGPILEEGKVIVDSSVAEELLPTTSGFFFGSTNYDQWYLDDLSTTVEIIDRALALDDGVEFTYQSSW